MSNKKPCYIWDYDLLKQCDQLPAVKGRASLVHNLIVAYGLLDKLQCYASIPASYQQLRVMHSELYLDRLKTFNEMDDEYTVTELDEKYGLGYDCPPFSGMYEVVSAIAGASNTAANVLVSGSSDVAINWCGGWHHGTSEKAKGYCYTNDIILAIQTLRKKFRRILYIDMDVHHGDAVQYAYLVSQRVYTLSIHKFEPGFYPGTGGGNSLGLGPLGGYYSVVPLRASYTDESFEYVFQRIFPAICEAYAPDAMVVQCGADALALDPVGGASLTPAAYCRSVQLVLEQRRPTLLLGGGGYKNPNAARLWTSITATVLGVDLDPNIPEHPYWPSYGPDFMLAPETSLARDLNDRCYLDECVKKVLDNLHDALLKHPKEKKFKLEREVRGPDSKKSAITPEVTHAIGDERETDHDESDKEKTFHPNALAVQKTNGTQQEAPLDVYEFREE